MGKVMTECPDTGQVVASDLNFDKQTYDTADFATGTFDDCLACGGSHTFAKEDAWVEDESGGGRETAGRGMSEYVEGPPGVA